MKVKDISDAAVIYAYQLSQYNHRDKSPFDYLCEHYKIPKVVLRKLEKMEHRGQIESGVSIRWYWPNEI